MPAEQRTLTSGALSKMGYVSGPTLEFHSEKKVTDALALEKKVTEFHFSFNAGEQQ